MPFLKQQIEIINAAFRAGVLKDKRFQSGRFEAIAVEVPRTNAEGKIEIFPGIMNSNYQPDEVTLNDTYPIIIYHKVMSSVYSVEKTSTGDGNNSMVQKTEAKMVVYGKYAALKLRMEQLEGLITTNFPDSIAKALISPYKLTSMTVALQSSNLKSIEVFYEEYKGFDLFLSAEDILFSVKYQIESRFRKGCFDICDCE